MKRAATKTAMTTAITRRRSVALGCALCLSWAFGRPVLGLAMEPSADSTAGQGAATQPAPTRSLLDEQGLGTGFSYEVLETPSYDPETVDMEPNANSVVDQSTDSVVYNDVLFEFDTMSGATPLYVRSPDSVEIDQAEKDRRMFWTVQPPLGIVEGEFYRAEKEFNGGYIARTDLVIKDGNIVHIEMDEHGPDDYYAADWAGEGKRRSGYGFFQAKSPRTHETLMVTPNAFNYLEWQVLRHNSLNIPLQGVRGISNSARDAFIPEIHELCQTVQNPSGRYYIGIALPVEQGVTARLELVFEDSDIVEARYDEIFADRAEDIADPAYQKYYRQSKLDSVDYEEDVPEFRAFAAALTEAVVSSDSLDVEVPAEFSGFKELDNYRDLASRVSETVNGYLADGYVHDIGSIAEPKDIGEVSPIFYRTEDLTATHKSVHYDPGTQTMTVDVEVSNNAEAPVNVLSEWFFLYTRIGDDKYDNVGDPNKTSYTLEAGETKVITLHFYPIYDSDLEVIFKYDGPNKIYESLGAPEDFR